MDIKIPIEGYVVPESKTFAHATRMADCWRAAPEEIVQPAMRVGPGELHVAVAEGSTRELNIVRRTRSPLKMLHRKQTMDMAGKYVFDTRYEVDTNIGHYIVDTIPKILSARQALAAASGEKVEIQAVLKEGTSRLSIESFANFSIPVVCTEADVVGRIVRIREVAPQTWTQGTPFSNGGTLVARLPELYTAFREKLVNRAPSGPEKIFVSRKSSRTIENEDEITAILKSHGFERYYFETGELTVMEQWRLMAGAKEIVAIHGAGLTPLIFNAHGLARERGDLSGLRIVELHGAGYFVDFNRRLASIVNAHWCGVRGRITPEVVRDLDDRGGGRVHQSSSFRVDPESLGLALAYSASASQLQPSHRALA